MSRKNKNKRKSKNSETKWCTLKQLKTLLWTATKEKLIQGKESI